MVLNKIDLPGAEPERVCREIEKVVGCDCSDVIYCSAKEGIGIKEILTAICQKIPPPQDTAERSLRALFFDSYYDAYRGVIVYFRVIDGIIKKGDRFHELRDALEKLQLNDAALKFEPETSSSMGFGFRCGFLGLLHMEIVHIEMLTPKDYIGALMELAQDRRGDFKEIKFITENRASLTYELPMAEMVGDFFDQLKSRSKGYASIEYSFIG
ncbi:translation factor guf1 homolog chloroplastic [Phtheirospermum japonicum]|uniref:Translation factor guf1 homolog chloroplastic n=1 Tax=Phtheirospermum japonicum TaxID=374723 RepID=A0A830B699_9LAMI|nr:translation factor guf1 homolog chloroplastic [Phtheirospermum japonicum]